MPLPTRIIGTSQVSAIGFGSMGLSAFYGKVPPDEQRLNVRFLPSHPSMICQQFLMSHLSFWMLCMLEDAHSGTPQMYMLILSSYLVNGKQYNHHALGMPVSFTSSMHQVQKDRQKKRYIFSHQVWTGTRRARQANSQSRSRVCRAGLQQVAQQTRCRSC
jgi:hypothetical protein